jgi:hypothetical protein
MESYQTTNPSINTILLNILREYYTSFSAKTYDDESSETDPLMNAFGITQELKQENKQYWGRELGMCWQRLVTDLCRNLNQDFEPALRLGSDEPCDFRLGQEAIDTKYRVGSGDSGTLKKFRAYGNLLIEQGYRPILLILREDNLPTAMTAFRQGRWEIYQGDKSFKYIQDKTGFDLKHWLLDIKVSGDYLVTRNNEGIL